MSTSAPDKPRTTEAPTPEWLFAQTLSVLQSQYARSGGEPPTPRAAATIAALRRADPGKVMQSPATWDILYRTFPEGDLGSGEDTSPRERAAHAALVLYAVHQTSQTHGVHRPNVRLGQALGRLPGAKDEHSPVLRRFSSLIAATTFEATTYHLRSLISLLRRDDIALDHVRLYLDLIDLQNPAKAPGVRRQWGRDFFGGRPSEPDAPTPADTATSTTFDPA